MRFIIVVVGKTKVPYLSEGEADYLKRLKRYCQIQIQIIKDKKTDKQDSVKDILRIEGSRILKMIPRRSVVVVLDRKGEIFSSEALAEKICQWQNRGTQEVIFIVGGPFGLSESILLRADLVLSLSKMTFTHEMTRLILMEQLYRSFTIMRGEKYHK